MENQALSEELALSAAKCENVEQELQDKSERLEESCRARQEAERQLSIKSKEIENLRNKFKEVYMNVLGYSYL